MSIEDARTAAGFQTVSTRIAYSNPWTAVREDIIIHPNGKKGLYGIVERGEFVVILPMHADGRVTLIQQFRYPVGERLLELPMGMWETKENVDPVELALGELREETGLRAGEMIHAGTMYQGAGYSNQKGHVFLARNLTRGETELEETEQDITTQDMTLAEFEALIARGELKCMVSLAAFALIRAKGLI
ncbi:NUDIX domain-containing protein [Gluconobacter frateurii]|uniref:GDP-mannose pyrophosphatase n=1 Tax=Gluconobacter frateurii NRIC 0228 TaxID=1307946 RepID=A0ABQ0QBF3_9PROT|nr:NUDIX hydrolase [Gluconobacter frateurii]OAG74251.1 ADP-ribose pyrophosphatase [Gluconobacter japonicus]GBR11908.1 ADP-ribose pyrophosphatase [Gluconobacter frateurii NRIC 0228]GLP89266.1 ADP-ribose pyrophosphatase [Gluconobacter frateurii]